MTKTFEERLASAFPNIKWDNLDKMTDDDSCVAGLLGKIQPRRHLEFDYPFGDGGKIALQSTDAHVWLVRDARELAEKVRPYAPGSATRHFHDLFDGFSKSFKFCEPEKAARDAYFIEKTFSDEYAPRISRIICDSRAWDDEAYPDGFFDTVVVNYRDSASSLRSDLFRALRLLKPGGLLITRYFSLSSADQTAEPHLMRTTSVIAEELPMLRELCDDLFAIEGTRILCAARKRETTQIDRARESSIFASARQDALLKAREEALGARRDSLPLTPLYKCDATRRPSVIRYGNPEASFPDNKRDHIATQWFNIPDNTLNIFLSLKFGETGDSKDYQCFVQADDFSIISSGIWPPKIGDEIRMRLARSPMRVRVMLMPIDATPHAIPEEMIVMGDSAESHWMRASDNKDAELAKLRELLREWQKGFDNIREWTDAAIPRTQAVDLSSERREAGVNARKKYHLTLNPDISHILYDESSSDLYAFPDSKDAENTGAASPLFFAPQVPYQTLEIAFSPLNASSDTILKFSDENGKLLVSDELSDEGRNFPRRVVLNDSPGLVRMSCEEKESGKPVKFKNLVIKSDTPSPDFHRFLRSIAINGRERQRQRKRVVYARDLKRSPKTKTNE